MIIGISGKNQNDNDTVGRIIQYLTSKQPYQVSIEEFITNEHWLVNSQNANFQIKKFADKLKDIVCLIISCTREQLENREFKEKELGEEWDIKIITYIDGELHKIYNPSDYEDFDIKCKYPISYTSNVIKQTPRSLLQKIGTDLFRNQLHPNTWVSSAFANYLNNAWIFTDVRFPNELEAIKDRNGIIIKIARYNHQDGSEVGWGNPKELDNAKFDYEVENTNDILHLINQIKEILIKRNII